MVQKCKGVVTAHVYIQCESCDHEWDELDRRLVDGECEIATAVFGATDKPAKWDELEIKTDCPKCGEEIVIDSLEW